MHDNLPGRGRRALKHKVAERDIHDGMPQGTTLRNRITRRACGTTPRNRITRRVCGTTLRNRITRRACGTTPRPCLQIQDEFFKDHPHFRGGGPGYILDFFVGCGFVCFRWFRQVGDHRNAKNLHAGMTGCNYFRNG